MVRKASIAMLAIAVLAAGSAQAGDVSLSRVIVKVPDDSDFNVDIPFEATYQYCGDDDGCEIALTMRMTGGGHVSTARLFLAPLTGEWFTSVESTYRLDGNSSTNQALAVVVATTECRITDVEGPSGDDTIGFRVELSGTDAATSTCTMVMSD